MKVEITDKYIDLIDNMQELRKMCLMTQKEFAKTLQVPLQTVQKWEINDRQPKNYWLRLTVFYMIEHKYIDFQLLRMKKFIKEFGQYTFDSYIEALKLEKRGADITELRSCIASFEACINNELIDSNTSVREKMISAFKNLGLMEEIA